MSFREVVESRQFTVGKPMATEGGDSIVIRSLEASYSSDEQICSDYFF